MAKLSHFWKWQIGRFWYFNVSTVPGEKKSCLSGLVQNGQLAPVWLDPSRSESPKTPLNTPKQLWHPKISPKSIETPLQTTKNKKDTNRHQPILPDVKSAKTTLRDSLKMHDRVRLEPILHFGKTVKGKTFIHLTLLRHQNIKTSLHTTSKYDWVLPFSYFSCLSERNYNLQSFWITLYMFLASSNTFVMLKRFNCAV